MRQSTSYRFMRSVSGQLMFVLALLGLLLLGSSLTHAAPAASSASTVASGGFHLFGKQKSRTAFRTGTHSYRFRNERSHRKGLLGWLTPRHSRSAFAARRRTSYHSVIASRPQGRSGRHASFWKRIGLKD